jgi:hypothetical protein
MPEWSHLTQRKPKGLQTAESGWTARFATSSPDGLYIEPLCICMEGSGEMFATDFLLRFPDERDGNGTPAERAAGGPTSAVTAGPLSVAPRPMSWSSCWVR